MGAASATTSDRLARRLAAVIAFLVIVAVTLAVVPASASTVARPTNAQIQAQTRAAVHASNAQLVSLRVVPPNLVYSLTVQVNDPAAYLTHRVNRVADVINRLTMAQWHFRTSSFTVLDRSGKRAFYIKQNNQGSSSGYDSYVRPGLAACIDNNNFGIESNPDGTAPACPAN